MPKPKAELTPADRREKRASPRVGIVLPLAIKARALELAEARGLSLSALLADLVQHARLPRRREALLRHLRAAAARWDAAGEPHEEAAVRALDAWHRAVDAGTPTAARSALEAAREVAQDAGLATAPEDAALESL